MKSQIQAKTEEGNSLCMIAAEIIKMGMRLELGFTLENPMSSMIWDFPPMKEVMEMPGIFCVEVDYCMYGEDWKKPTTFITNIKQMSALGRKCTGSFGQCSRTGLGHRELRGRAPCGARWAQLACAYPIGLCRKYAEIVQGLEPHWASVPSGARVRLRHGVNQIVKSRGPAIALQDHWLEKKWHVLFQGKWNTLEHNNVLELRTVVAVLRHLSRTSQAWGYRVLFFTDSLVSLGVLRKGRSSARVLLQQARVAGIIQMVCRIRGYFRWVPSELNLADGPSRGLGIGAADETVELHKARGVPKDILRRLRERERRAGHARPHL